MFTSHWFTKRVISGILKVLVCVPFGISALKQCTCVSEVVYFETLPTALVSKYLSNRYALGIIKRVIPNEKAEI